MARCRLGEVSIGAHISAFPQYYYYGDIWMNALVDAVERGNIDTVKDILDRNNVVNTKQDGLYYSPILILACAKGELPIVKHLIEERNAKVNITLLNDFFTYAFVPKSALIESCLNGHIEIVQYLIEKAEAKVNHAAKENSNQMTIHTTPLTAAIQSGHFGISKYLIRNGACIDGTDGANPLVSTVKLPTEQHQFMNYLLESKANPHTPTFGGESPLVCACIAGSKNRVKKLLEAKANPNKQSKAEIGGEWVMVSPLIASACEGKVNVVELLLDYGVNVYATNSNNRSALFEAIAGGHLETTKILLDRTSLSLSHRDNAGKTAREMARVILRCNTIIGNNDGSIKKLTDVLEWINVRRNKKLISVLDRDSYSIHMLYPSIISASGC
ncbi:hypothetical protein AAMO2058_000682900 [Amorphochlora amoebiformis]